MMLSGGGGGFPPQKKGVLKHLGVEPPLSFVWQGRQAFAFTKKNVCQVRRQDWVLVVVVETKFVTFGVPQLFLLLNCPSATFSEGLWTRGCSCSLLPAQRERKRRNFSFFFLLCAFHSVLCLCLFLLIVFPLLPVLSVPDVWFFFLLFSLSPSRSMNGACVSCPCTWRSKYFSNLWILATPFVFPTEIVLVSSCPSCSSCSSSSENWVGSFSASLTRTEGRKVSPLHHQSLFFWKEEEEKEEEWDEVDASTSVSLSVCLELEGGGRGEGGVRPTWPRLCAPQTWLPFIMWLGRGREQN